MRLTRLVILPVLIAGLAGCVAPEPVYDVEKERQKEFDSAINDALADVDTETLKALE
ncbi:hypothetical protein [Oceanomicrobium pacificus]|uniref:Lipoprotein n=1 Tax=Oceanomicrobium pacificus TaxID=2692916 RepID=A0A6B0TXX9_9RHOB|nr:hypothetical protein [Oceanomicrobium pacificus]MXU66565.1 hypothetical protein [Oceanomicrobium pacificus]